MKRILTLQALALCFATCCFADDSQQPRGALASRPAGTAMVEDNDGNLQQGEYEVISTNGSITRALCPYTCEMRGLPQDRCRTWKSENDPSQCYVQDTSIPSNAVPLDGSGNGK